MAGRGILRSRILQALLAVGILITLLKFLNVNFEAYGVGNTAEAPEEILHPGSPPVPNVWTTIPGTHPPRRNESGANIPNIVHFVYLLPEGVEDFSFRFKEVLAVYAAWAFTDPDTIYLHTNASPEAIQRARSGTQGKWNSIILNVPQLVVRPVESPDHANNGVKILKMQHKGDFVRVAALEEIGGIYLDMDAIPLRDLRPLIETGFNTVLGRQADGDIMSGNFMGKAGCRFFTQWRESMHQVFDQGWITHSNHLMGKLAKPLSAFEREILIMESPVMGPVHWAGGYTQVFYRVHNDVESNLKGLQDGSPLRDFTNYAQDEGKHPPWQHDYSDTYILHSWHERRGLRLPQGFARITPRYVLERKSDFSRAVYHIAKRMYEQGFIGFDDPWRYTTLEQ